MFYRDNEIFEIMNNYEIELESSHISGAYRLNTEIINPVILTHIMSALVEKDITFKFENGYLTIFNN